MGNEVVLGKLDEVSLMRWNFNGLLVLVVERRWYGCLIVGCVLDFRFGKLFYRNGIHVFVHIEESSRGSLISKLKMDVALQNFFAWVR